MKRQTQWIVIRQVATNELRLVKVYVDYKMPPPNPAYTWGGPFKSSRSANKAIQEQDKKLFGQLYPAEADRD
jgi:hypothetical protein